MTTLIERLDPSSEDWETLYAMCGIFLKGECYAFAIALHEGLGWPIVGLLRPDGLVEHAVVRAPDGRFFDARGWSDKDTVGEPFGGGRFPLKELTPEDLHAIRPVQEMSVRSARWRAEALWPELPWLTSEAAHLAAMMEEIEKVCRKYERWICAPVPGQWPVIHASFGPEEGFTLRPTLNGPSHLVDRRTKI